MASEKRTFGMHPNLLFDVILRQAGTLQKALLEGIMNAIDAGATTCKVTLDTHSFTVEDDGRGIQTRQEIEEFFETFGTPHQEGDAVYGRFRMGRGQMMAYGRNIWRSRTFGMDVDVKKTGLDYTLTEHAEDLQGTRIHTVLYDPMKPSDLERTKAELRKFVAWAPIPVVLNGTVVSKPAADGTWTYEDEDAYYALSTERQQMAIYNLGVLVNHFHAGRFGIGGTVVTKRRIDVNFARNDVQSSCPVFKRIQDHIRKQTTQAVVKKTKLTDSERDLMAREFVAGTVAPDEALKLRVITDVRGRNWPLDKLAQIPGKFSGRILLAERGDQMADTAQHTGLAFTIDQATLERFGANTVQEFLERIEDVCQTLVATCETGNRYHPGVYAIRSFLRALPKIEVATRADLNALLNDGYIIVPESEIKAEEKIFQKAISAALPILVSFMNGAHYEDLKFRTRSLRMGRSDIAHAWTDGTSYICVNIKHARLLRNGYAGAHQIALTLLHEMLHTGPDTGTHEHDLAFYQAYHDLSGLIEDPVGRAAHHMVAHFLKELRQNGKKIGAKMLAHEDADLAIEQAHLAAQAREDAAA